MSDWTSNAMRRCCVSTPGQNSSPTNVMDTAEDTGGVLSRQCKQSSLEACKLIAYLLKCSIQGPVKGRDRKHIILKIIKVDFNCNFYTLEQSHPPSLGQVEDGP